MNKTYTGKTFYWITLAVSAVLFFVLSALTTFKPDDVMSSLVMGNMPERIHDLDSLMRSQAFRYVDNNGRLADFFAQLYCGVLGKQLFNVCNALVVALFLHVSSMLIARRRGSLLALAMVLTFIMTLMPVPGETMLWLCGSVNYLWALTATLMLISWMQSDASRGTAPWWKHAIVLLLALLAGAMNESVSACTLLALVLYFAFNRKSFTGMIPVAVIGYALGVVVIFASPAMWNRLDAGGDVNLHITTMQMFSRRVINTCTKSLHFVTPVLAMAGIVVALFRRKFKALFSNVLVWAFLCALLMIVVLSITTSYRSYTTFAVYSFLVVAQWCHGWIDGRRWTLWIAAALLVGCAVLAVIAVCDVYKYKVYDDGVTAAIEAASSQCVLPASQSPVVSRWVYPVVYDNDGYMTHKHYYCSYYGKENMQFLAPDIYVRYKSDDMMAGGVPASFAPTDTSCAVQLMTFPGHPYSIVNMGKTCPRFADTHAKVFYESMEDHIGAERSAKLKRWGEFPDFMPMSMYYLKHGDNYYIVLPELEPDIVAIEVPLMVNNADYTLRFNRTDSIQP